MQSQSIFCTTKKCLAKTKRCRIYAVSIVSAARFSDKTRGSQRFVSLDAQLRQQRYAQWHSPRRRRGIREQKKGRTRKPCTFPRVFVDV
jgi:hypothetical protein